MNFWRTFTKLKGAHTSYLSLVLGLLSHTAVIYRLLIEQIPYLKALFPTIFHFAFWFWLLYVATLKVMGDYHFNPEARHPMWESLKLQNRANPWVRAYSTALYYMLEGDDEKAKEVLKPWVL